MDRRKTFVPIHQHHHIFHRFIMVFVFIRFTNAYLPFKRSNSRLFLSRTFLQGVSVRRSLSASRRPISEELLNSKNLITSTKSNTIRKVQALLQKRKKRTEFGQTIVEGPKSVFDLLANPRTCHLVRAILVSMEQASDFQLQLEEYLAENEEIALHVVESTTFQSVSATVTPQGIMAVVDIPRLEPISGGTKHRNLHLILDGVSDPGNVGTLLRSALAVGVSSVILLPGSCDVWNPKVVRSAMGASFQLPIVESPTWSSALEKVEALEVRTVYAATMIDEDERDRNLTSVPYYNINWIDSSSALVIGSEGSGLSPDVRAAVMTGIKHRTCAIKAVHVPMNPGIESLNAAVCGSVIMFEFLRQCSTAQKA